MTKNYKETEAYKLNLTIGEYYDEITRIYDLISKKEFTVSLGNSDYSRIVEALDDVDRSYHIAIRVLTNDSQFKYYTYADVLGTLKTSLKTMRKRIEELGV